MNTKDKSFYLKQTEALKLALEALKLNNAEWKALANSGDAGRWRAEDQPHYKQTEAAITAIEELSDRQPCKYPHCAYPCPDLPDCRDAEQPAQDEEQAHYKQVIDGVRDVFGAKRKQPAQQQEPHKQQEPYPVEEMQDEILRLSEIIRTNAFYQAGRADALEWAAQMAVLEDPRTSDWVYDDRHDLVKALRKGLDFPSSPPAQQQEPVAWMCSDESLVNKGYSRFSQTCEGAWNIPVYTSPPASKPWVSLTDKEIGVLWFEANDKDNSMIKHFARAIEAKLREKNA